MNFLLTNSPWHYLTSYENLLTWNVIFMVRKIGELLLNRGGGGGGCHPPSPSLSREKLEKAVPIPEKSLKKLLGTPLAIGGLKCYNIFYVPKRDILTLSLGLQLEKISRRQKTMGHWFYYYSCCFLEKFGKAKVSECLRLILLLCLQQKVEEASLHSFKKISWTNVT